MKVTVTQELIDEGSSLYEFSLECFGIEEENKGFCGTFCINIATFHEPQTETSPENFDFQFAWNTLEAKFDMEEKEAIRFGIWLKFHESEIEEIFGKLGLQEIASKPEYLIAELLLPYSNLKTEGIKDPDSLPFLARLLKKHLTEKDIFDIGLDLNERWLNHVDFDLLKELEKIKVPLLLQPHQ